MPIYQCPKAVLKLKRARSLVHVLPAACYVAACDLLIVLHLALDLLVSYQGKGEAQVRLMADPGAFT